MNNKRLENYQSFIDKMVDLKEGVLASWVRTNSFPKIEENEKINKFLAKFDTTDLEIIADLVTESRRGGIHDILVYFQESINMGEMKILMDDIEIANEPYGTEMFYDFICRCEGDEWPEDDLNEEYR